MDGTSEVVTSADGTPLRVLTAGAGPGLLLVHGGMRTAQAWAPLWDRLAERHLVAALDRRGRGRSGDAPVHSLEAEFDDVAAVADRLLARTGTPVDVVGSSYGAVCALGAAARSAPVRWLVLHEPPGPETVPLRWRAEVAALLEAGDAGRAVVSFLVDVIGMRVEEVRALAGSPDAHDAVDVAARTMRREAEALAGVDLEALARRVRQPVVLLLGDRSPAWARAVTDRLRRALPRADVVVLPGQGHDAVDAAPDLVLRVLQERLAG